MLPENQEECRAAFLRWSNGDASAAAFLEQIAAIVRLADNIVDEEKDRQRNMAWLLEWTMTVLPQNQFFVRNVPKLSPLISVIILEWHLSDQYRISGNPLKEQFGFVMREGIGKLIMAVAHLAGGYDHAKATAEDYFAVCHSLSTETVEQWVHGN